MKKAFVIGLNVSNSLSPYIFNYWIKKYNINASYSYKEIAPDNFNKEIKNILHDDNICGFNVTIPYKELIIKELFGLNQVSKNIGAVNCVSKINKKWIGKNTDWLGFYKSIEASIDKDKKNKALILGYGGAAKAIIYSLKKLNFNKIALYNRTYTKIEHLEKHKTIKLINKNDILKEIKKSDLVVNTTPVNLLKDLNTNQKQIKTLACDIVYKPKQTDFLSNFDINKRIYGIYMLLYQAAPCFEEWFGFAPKIDNKIIELIDKKIKL